LYIELLKKVLIDLHRAGVPEYRPVIVSNPGITLKLIDQALRKSGLCICREYITSKENRIEGKDWPVYADSMVGLKRLNNIELCFNSVINDNIPGDFIETGVWRGGSCIFMKALLKSRGINDRIVWVADSFEGLPRPDAAKYKYDKDDPYHTFKELAVPLEVVQANFEKYDLWDDNVRFLKGWFKDTLPNAPIEKLAILRLDGDMYESTMDGLKNLYPRLSNGGYIIIDDWGAVKGCQQAVIDYRKTHGISDEIIQIDWTGVYWRKS
jgi:O-methyltransferase